MSGFLLTSYPVPAAYRARLRGTLRAAGAAHDRRPSPAVARLRSCARSAHSTERACVAAESESARALLPMLAVARRRDAGASRSTSSSATSSRAEQRDARALTALSGCRRRVDRRPRRGRATRRDARRLLAQPRAAAVPDLARGLVHLNATPWLGLTAGGSIAHTAGVANALADEGLDVTVCGYGDVAGLRDGVRVERLRPPRGYALPADSNRYRFARAAPAQVAGRRPRRRSSTSGSRSGPSPAPTSRTGSACRSWSSTTAPRSGRPRTGTVVLATSRSPRLAEDASLRHAHLVVTVSETLARRAARARRGGRAHRLASERRRSRPVRPRAVRRRGTVELCARATASRRTRCSSRSSAPSAAGTASRCSRAAAVELAAVDMQLPLRRRRPPTRRRSAETSTAARKQSGARRARPAATRSRFT